MSPIKAANKIAFQPKAVPAGRRVRATPKKKHKDKPKIGKEQYVKAPLLRDKVTRPRWIANAAVNNPGTAVAGTAVGGGGLVLLSEKKKVSKKDDRKREAAGAAVGGGAAHLARQQADYGTKALAERQFKRLTTKGNYGPYTETEHKPALNKYKRVANKAGGGSVRAKAKFFDENFPKGIPSHKARKAGVVLNKKPVVAGVAVAGAAGGAGAAALSRKKVKKSMTVSAFGVDHA